MKTYEERLEELVNEAFQAAGISNDQDLSEKELALAEEITKKAQDQARLEFENQS